MIRYQAMLNPKESEKPRVIECLYEMYKSGKIKEGVVTSDQVLDAIKRTGAKLGKANPANFLKDIVRSVNANSIWPESLRKAALVLANVMVRNGSSNL